jgi:hypothetical protein
MQKSVEFPDRLGIDPMGVCGWMMFLQMLTNRYVVGDFRYGKPKRKKKYLSRLRREVEAYGDTGNMEHLLNAAVYCWLESEAPENDKFHFDNTVDSVTRQCAAEQSSSESSRSEP